jgi:hypothetical protein
MTHVEAPEINRIRQCDSLFRHQGIVFPLPNPRATKTRAVRLSALPDERGELPRLCARADVCDARGYGNVGEGTANLSVVDRHCAWDSLRSGGLALFPGATAQGPRFSLPIQAGAANRPHSGEFAYDVRLLWRRRHRRIRWSFTQDLSIFSGCIVSGIVHPLLSPKGEALKKTSSTRLTYF